MSGLMVEWGGTFARQLLTAFPGLTRTALSFCCAPGQEAWVSTWLLQTPALYLTQTGTPKMTFKWAYSLTKAKHPPVLVIWHSNQIFLYLFLCAIFFVFNIYIQLNCSSLCQNTFFLSSFLQAQARCHRIGQSKAVKIYRLITRNSYEREMFDKASLKLGLDKAVLQSMSGRENAANGVQVHFICDIGLYLHIFWTNN